MKVLHITNNYPTSQYPIFGIFVKEQIDSLSVKGISNKVFFMNTRMEGKKEYLYGILRLMKIFLTRKYDIIHCHHSFSGIIFTLSILGLFKKKILSYQNPPYIEGGRFLFIINTFIFNRIIIKNHLKEVDSKKIIYVPNGVNLNSFFPMDQGMCKKALNLDPNKRYILFMDSYNRRTQKRYDRYEKTIRILKRKYGIHDIVELVLTNTERDKIPLYINSVSLHLLSSDFEGSPNSVKECLACNRPVVTTPVGNVHELLDDVEGCFVSKSFNAEELAELCFEALKHETIKGRDKIIRMGLTSDEVAEHLKTIYIELTAKK